MKAWIFSSCLATQISAFIELRRLSGTDYHSQARMLQYVDRFLVDQHIQAASHHPRDMGWLSRQP